MEELSYNRDRIYAHGPAFIPVASLEEAIFEELWPVGDLDGLAVQANAVANRLRREGWVRDSA